MISLNGEKHTDPFNHWVIDNALSGYEFYKNWFPEVRDDWYRYENHFEKKRAMDRLSEFDARIREVLLYGNSQEFLPELEKLTGIEGLIPDPYFRGGGAHVILPGGKLDVHLDFNLHPKLKLKRRLNMLLYFNEHYLPDYRGQLELWSEGMKECVKKVEPLGNRLVIFETPNALHGHPDPWQGPTPRKSLAWYFYTADSVAEAHSTCFKKRPNEETTDEIESLRLKRNGGRL